MASSRGTAFNSLVKYKAENIPGRDSTKNSVLQCSNIITLEIQMRKKVLKTFQNGAKEKTQKPKRVKAKRKKKDSDALHLM